MSFGPARNCDASRSGRSSIDSASAGSVQNELSHWFGSYADQIHSFANGNLQYNMAILARNHLGCVVTIRLDCRFDGLEFVPLSPKLETGTVLVWKKVQVFSPATTAFLEEAKEYLSGMKEDVN